MPGEPVTTVDSPTAYFSTWLTSAYDRVEHAVTDEAMAAGMTAGTGRYGTVCGAEVDSASLVEPAGSRCRACARFLQARATLRDLPTRMERRPSLLVRLWHRVRKQPAGPQTRPSNGGPVGVGRRAIA